MKIADWYCAKCDEKMTKKKIAVEYMGKIGFEEGYYCPKCWAKFLSEEVVCRDILSKEMHGEAKLD